MNAFMPFFYIFLGYMISKYWGKSSKTFSFLLVNIFIPAVVFITIATYKGKIFYIIALSFAFSVLMYRISNYFFTQNKKDSKIFRLCFSYYNIGWLGLPVATYLFGESIAPLIIAAYIGGMLFGSTVCIHSLNSIVKDFQISPMKKLITSPPFIAFVLGVILKITSNIEIGEYVKDFYLYAKFIMSFLGMAILGMWLQKTPIEKSHWKSYLLFSFLRLVVGILLFSGLLSLFFYYEIITSLEFKQLLIIPLLPIAANIVVLETYYLKNAISASIISINTLFSLTILVLLGVVLRMYSF